MNRFILLLIIPFLSFGQNNGYVTDTVKLINSFGGIYDNIFSLGFQSLTSKKEITNYKYSDTDGDGLYNYDSPSSIEKNVQLTGQIISFDHVGWEKSTISWDKMDGLINEGFIITYTIKKYGIDNSDEHLGIYENKTGNYLISIQEFSLNEYEQERIKQVLFMQEKYWNEGSVDGFMLGYWNSEKLEFSSKNKTIQGWDNIKSKYKKSYPSKHEMGKLRFKINNMKLNSDTTALVNGEWELLKIDSNPTGTFSLTFQKFNNDWLIIKDYTTEK